jgi:hypothetical protein
MRALQGLVLFTLLIPIPAGAFDNIEADVAYNGPIKERLRIEFAGGLKLLNEQASALGVSVREEDIQKLRYHIYYKAYIAARCLDKAITMRKTTSIKVDPGEYTRGCEKVHVDFKDWFQRLKDPVEKGALTCLLRGTVVRADTEARPFDFLKLDEPNPIKPYIFLYDYLRIKECVDSQCADGSLRPKYCNEMPQFDTAPDSK